MNQKKSYRLCQISLCLLALAGILYAAAENLHLPLHRIWHVLPPCFFRRFTGFYCPGCGGTRSVHALLGGHILRSLWYHPIVFYGAACYGWYLLTNTLEWILGGKLQIGSRYHAWQGYLAVGIVLINWFLRNLMLFCFHIAI